ncbi:hypothetical protein K1T71_001361 [Dendrolimus kikuchii]|uniref:Uncharacterized protein n=1 Tax=Dendrolimus kikuchii TaxID=765133 RepID=A0ACC1DHW8_9NEOP|nr:hypothetical protein K1T71_001361 [Dendrolimus kikuchii]
MITFIKVCLLLHIAFAGDIGKSPFITKCKWDDSNCLKSSTQDAIPIFAKGIPELEVETLDPIYVANLDASSKTLNLLLKNITGTGLKDTIVKKVLRSISESKLLVKLQCTVDFKGQYEMKGRLLFVPIEGNGGARVILRKIIITVEVDLGEKTGDDGLKRWNINDWKHSYELKDKATIELENLFNGNKILGFAAHNLIASNSNEIVLEVGPPIVKAIVEKIVDNVKRFFEKVPAEELELI